MDDLKAILDAATPGGWFCEEDPRVGMEWNIHIHYTTEDRICFMSNMGSGRVDEVTANARLIAMAPDLAADKIRLEDENARLREALETEERISRLLGSCRDIQMLMKLAEQLGRAAPSDQP